ncbi:M14 family metallopeptidase [Fodinibius salsisoli]|uniref:Zinc carboxypeptidase n=1 Tax=Fodinibius salsisoli TaxID=2820877 RepID=A0ABT3PMU0_9BACT|nr:M14 family metallopeptidase [Fodinibius salsisoli]MCW9707033.1 zinc carboxypeptidase [Fodinibius salsisoli]
MSYRKCWLVLIFIFLSISAHAQLQSPSEFLGYELGSEWTPHHKVMDYFWHAAEQSPLVEGESYGETYEGRQLMVVYIASEENVDQLEQIRTDNLKRTGLIDGEPANNQTAIVWLSYNVHGNETSSSEAAMKTLYELTRPDNDRTKQWLQNTVVIMDPMLNPDGRDRYVHWYKETVGADPNIHEAAREHHEPWPNGRTNHYYFDLNRDWAWLTQKESRQRLAKYQQWMPHIHVDFHEQGHNAPYYFAPAAKPFHNAITDWQEEFQYTIGRNHAKYFNENGWLYFTREVFDLFYPSYGDTYPIFNGAIGMTYEQGGQVGLSIKLQEGDTLTLDDRLTHHHTTGLSTVETASKHAGDLVREFEEYYEQSNTEPAGKYKTFIIKGDNNPDKIRSLFALLDRHQVRYGKAKTDRSLEGYNYATGKSEDIQVTEDDYLVSAFQPKSVLARVLFEPQPQLEDSVTYDITAWEQHYAFGLEGYALTERLEVEVADTPQQANPDPVSVTGQPYAYLLPWKDIADAKALAALLKEDINVRFTQKEIRLDGETYQPGTLVIPRADNQNLNPQFDQLVQQVATEHHRDLVTVSTGFAASGVDFGSSSVRYLAKPHVALLSGRGTSSNRVGEVWHFFDQQVDYPLTMINTDYFENIDLDNYDVLILPAGRYSDILGEGKMKELKAWVLSGGKLIALGRSNAFLAGKEGFKLKKKEIETDSLDQQRRNTYGGNQRKRISEFNSGSIYKIAMDPTHPLAFGYGDDYFSLKRNAAAYGFLENGWNVGFAKEDAHMSGFIGYKAKEKLQDTLTFGVQEMGEGSIIYLVDNPLFRAFWHNGKLLFGNAVFLVGN